ncbi:MAG TPA: discoidin domain-containing protein [bacterium]|nr:discoidin domain-containing protein [bacterium]
MSKYLTAILSFFLILSSAHAEKTAKVSKDSSYVIFDGKKYYIDNYTPPENKTYLSESKFNKLAKVTTDDLPVRVDHSFSKYMQPVFSQVGGSCGSASRISYMFGYELNSHRDEKADDLLSQYPSHFTWLLTGQNSGKAEMAKFNGVPNAFYYSGFPVSSKYGGGDIYWPDEEEAPDYGWMNGYNRWMNAMHNRLDENVFLDLNNPDNLETLKNWMHNHLGDDDFHEGGVAGAGVATGGMNMVSIPDSLHEGGKYIVKNWGPQVDHGTTWSGYDDSVGYDFNGDGQITNDIDITGDGKVNMADWERGALIMLNSWGDGWANNGTVYVPYRLLKIDNMGAELYYIRKNYEPEKVMKVKMEYNKRSNLKLSIGIAADSSATEPDKTMACHHFINAGNGEIPMLGRWADGEMHDEPMEFALDLTDLTENIDTSKPHKYFLYILTKRFTTGQGKLHELSVVDYKNDENEYFYEDDTVMISGGDSKFVGITVPGDGSSAPDYVYLPQSEMEVHYFDSQEDDSSVQAYASNVLDGDQSTIWHTEWVESDPVHPHEIQLKLDSTYQLSAFSYLPRQSGSNGRIKDYEFYVATNDSVWGEPVAEGTWLDNSSDKIVEFTSQKAQFVRLVALSEVNDNPWTSVAELNLFKASDSTATRLDRTQPVATDFKLYNNYPNPFNPSTNLHFYLPNSRNVIISVYNIKGQLVRKLIDNNLSAGDHKIKFNAEGLASGVYIYKIKAGPQSKVGKMLLYK